MKSAHHNNLENNKYFPSQKIVLMYKTGNSTKGLHRRGQFLDLVTNQKLEFHLRACSSGKNCPRLEGHPSSR